MQYNIKKSVWFLRKMCLICCRKVPIVWWEYLAQAVNGLTNRATRILLICHWNLNSICAHNFAKLSLLRAYVSVHKFDVICLSETYLDSSTDDEILEISGYYLIRSDHSSNKKRGGICIYYKNILPLKEKKEKPIFACSSQ